MVNRDDQEPSSVDFERMSKRRHLWILVALGGLVVVGVLVFVALQVLERQHRAELVRAWSELNACLIGDALADGEAPSTRVRNIQLSIMAVPPVKRAELGQYAWPASCGSYAHAVAEILRGQGSDAALTTSAEKLAKEIKEEKSYKAELGPVVEEAWRDAAALELQREPVEGVKAPPAPMQPINEGTLPKSSRLMTGTFSLGNLRVPQHPDPVLRLLVDDPDVPGGPALCRTSRSDTKLHCTYVPDQAAKLSPGLRLWGTTMPDAEPLIFAGDRGEAGIFTPGGKSLAATLSYGATSRKSGVVDLLSWDEDGNAVQWVRTAAGDAPSATRLLPRDEIGNPYYTVSMLWDWVVYKAYRDDADGLRLLVRKIGEDGNPSDEADVGKVWQHAQTRAYDDRPHITGCRTDKAVVARIAGTTADSFSFLVGDKWTAPVPGKQAGGVLTCRNAEATTTKISHFQKKDRNLASVSQNRCSVSSCAVATVTLADLLEGVEELAAPDTKTVKAVDIDGKLALVWQAGEHGGLRLRVGPPEGMKAAKDQVVYDDLVQRDGTRGISTLLAFEIVPGDRFALLFLRTMNEGVHVLRIEPDGTFRPVEVEVKE